MPEVRLHQHQPRRARMTISTRLPQPQQARRARSPGAVVVVEELGQHQDHAIFMNSAGCDAERPEHEPALRALGLVADELAARCSAAMFEHVDGQRHPLDEAVVHQADADTGRQPHARGSAAWRVHSGVCGGRDAEARFQMPSSAMASVTDHQAPGDRGAPSGARSAAASARTLRGDRGTWATEGEAAGAGGTSSWTGGGRRAGAGAEAPRAPASSGARWRRRWSRSRPRASARSTS